MTAFSWILLIAAALYGTLSAYEGFSDLKDEKASLLGNVIMIIGGSLILAAVVPGIQEEYQLVLLISGLAVILWAAVLNGLKMYGKIIIKHHVIRLFLSIMIIMLYFIKDNVIGR